MLENSRDKQRAATAHVHAVDPRFLLLLPPLPAYVQPRPAPLVHLFPPRGRQDYRGKGRITFVENPESW